MDGTQELDASGSPVQTYDNTDIMDFSRVWTGFTGQAARGNLEMRGFYYKGSETLSTGSNYVDPMALRPTWRDAATPSADQCPNCIVICCVCPQR